MSSEDSDESEDFTSFQELAVTLRRVYLECCAYQDWRLGMLRPSLQFFGAYRYTILTSTSLICRCLLKQLPLRAAEGKGAKGQSVLKSLEQVSGPKSGAPSKPPEASYVSPKAATVSPKATSSPSRASSASPAKATGPSLCSPTNTMAPVGQKGGQVNTRIAMDDSLFIIL